MILRIRMRIKLNRYGCREPRRSKFMTSSAGRSDNVRCRSANSEVSGVEFMGIQLLLPGAEGTCEEMEPVFTQYSTDVRVAEPGLPESVRDIHEMATVGEPARLA